MEIWSKKIDGKLEAVLYDDDGKPKKKKKFIEKIFHLIQNSIKLYKISEIFVDLQKIRYFPFHSHQDL